MTDYAMYDRFSADLESLMWDGSLAHESGINHPMPRLPGRPSLEEETDSIVLPEPELVERTETVDESVELVDTLQEDWLPSPSLTVTPDPSFSDVSLMEPSELGLEFGEVTLEGVSTPLSAGVDLDSPVDVNELESEPLRDVLILTDDEEQHLDHTISELEIVHEESVEFPDTSGDDTGQGEAVALPNFYIFKEAMGL